MGTCPPVDKPQPLLGGGGGGGTAVGVLVGGGTVSGAGDMFLEGSETLKGWVNEIGCLRSLLFPGHQYPLKWTW